MSQEIIYRQATWDDEPALSIFYKHHFKQGGIYRYPQRFNWLFRDNPFIQDKNQLTIWIAVDGEQIVGMCCLVINDFMIDGKIIKAGWSVDYRVSAAYRGRGVGYNVWQMRHKHANVIAVSGAQQTLNISKKIGDNTRSIHNVYMHIQRTNDDFILQDFARYLHINNIFVKKILSSIGMGRLLSFILVQYYNYALNKRNHLDGNTLPSLSFKSCDSFDDRINAVWDIVSKKYSMIVLRNTTYLNWKFVDQPDNQYLRYYVYDEDSLVGVLILRMGTNPEPPIGVIAECYSIDDDVYMPGMVANALSILYKLGVMMVQCSASTQKRKDILEKQRFIQFRADESLFSFHGTDANVIHQALMHGDWFIGLGDHEQDEYPRLKHPSLLQIVKALRNRIKSE